MDRAFLGRYSFIRGHSFVRSALSCAKMCDQNPNPLIAEARPCVCRDTDLHNHVASGGSTSSALSIERHANSWSAVGEGLYVADQIGGWTKQQGRPHKAKTVDGRMRAQSGRSRLIQSLAT